MTKLLSVGESQEVANVRSDQSASTRSAAALAALMETTEHDPSLAEVAANLLEGAVELLREHREPGVLPADEQCQWEALGARFPDEATVQRARLRVHGAVSALRSSGVHGDVEVAELLQVDRTRISQRVGERSLYAVHDDSGRWFPRWQFDGTRTLPHLKAVLAELNPELHPLTVAHWFTTPHAELLVDGEATSPRDWLLSGGGAQLVAQLAQYV